jgi:impB/mucB/samB family C-terminal domain
MMVELIDDFFAEYSAAPGEPDTIDMRGRTVTLKVKFSDFQIATRSRSRAEPFPWVKEFSYRRLLRVKQ